MKNLKNATKRGLALFIALIMSLSLLPMAAFADEGGGGEQPNPYQDLIDKATGTDGVVDQATEAKDTFPTDESYKDVAPSITDANEDAATAGKKADDAIGDVEAAEKIVSDAVKEQQGEVNDAEVKAEGKIDDAAQTIKDETQTVTDTLDAAQADLDAAMAKAQAELDKLDNENLTPEQKVEIAGNAQKAAQDAVEIAEKAAEIVEETREAVQEAMDAVAQAQRDYAKAVEDAEKAVDDAKSEAEKKLEVAEKDLADAQAALANAESAKEAADTAKRLADEQLKTAQGMLEAAQEAYEGIKWPEPEDGIQKEDVNPGAIEQKEKDAAAAESDANAAESAAVELGTEIEGLNGQVQQNQKDINGKKQLVVTKTGEIDTLDREIGALESKVDTFEAAKAPYTEAVDTATATYNNAIAAAKDEYLEDACTITDKVVDPKHDNWGSLGAALEISEGEWGPTLLYKGQDIYNNDFYYYLKISELLDGTDSPEYQELARNYQTWKEGIDPADPKKVQYYNALIACEAAVDANLDEYVKPAIEAYKVALKKAADALEEATAEGCRDITAVENAIDGMKTQINDKTTAIGNLRGEIAQLQSNIDELNRQIEELNGTITTKEGVKKTQEDTAKARREEAAAAREHAQKLQELLMLKLALENAEKALKLAGEAEEAAIEAQGNAQAALKNYQDASEKVAEAQRAVENANLSGSLNADELKALQAKLDAAKLAADEAKKNYDDAVKKALDAETEANSKKAEADDMKQAADDALEEWNNRNQGGDTSDVGDYTDDGIEIDDVAVPLASGPVTRAEFIDYLWRHEGEPSAAPCTFADVPADHEFVLALGWAQANSIVFADANGEFHPDDLITVSGVYTILANFADYAGMTMPAVLECLSNQAETEAVMNCDEVMAEFFGA